MHRWLTTIALAAGLAGLVAAQDTVTYHDRVTKKNDAQVTGVIQGESARGIKIKVREGKNEVVKEIPASDIQQVQYKVAGVLPAEFRAPFSKEFRGVAATGRSRDKLLGEALQLFLKLEGQLREAPNPRRYIQYKIAEVTAQLAQDDPTRVDEAIKLLTEFKTAHPTSWAIVPALKKLAKMQEDQGKPDDARKTYEELAQMDVADDLKKEASILVGRLMLRVGKYKEAQKQLQTLADGMKPGDAQKPFVDAYLAEAKMGLDRLDGVQKELLSVIRASNDTRLRGVAYNLLGDYYRRRGQLEDAFWAYLRVDAMYNEDAESQAKALYRLADLFDKVKKDPIRGKDCLQRLRDKRFAGTTYQKLLPPAEKSEPEVKKPAKKKKG